MPNLEFCFYPKKISSVQEALQRLCGPSKNLLKKFNIIDLGLLNSNVDGQTFLMPLDLVYSHRIQPSQTSAIPWATETKDWIAFHKPPQLHSHPLKYSETNNALSHLIKFQSSKYYSLS